MTEATKKEPRKAVDWDLIEIDYRAGMKSLRQIADEHGITHGAVNKHAKGKKWPRDLSAKIHAAADAKVSKAAVSAEVSAEKVATEQAVVEANAEIQYRIRLEHRADIGRTRKLFQALLGEMETAQQKMAIGGRIDGSKRLAEMLEKIIRLERQAFGIDDAASRPDEESWDVRMRRLFYGDTP